MTINMIDDSVVSMAQLKELVKLGNSATFIRNNQTEAYRWINLTLGKFRYFRESKKNRGIIKQYIRSMTGYSDPQVDRLIRNGRNGDKSVISRICVL